MPKRDSAKNFYVNKTGVASPTIPTTKNATVLIREHIVETDASVSPDELKTVLARYGKYPKIGTIRAAHAQTNAMMKMLRDKGLLRGPSVLPPEQLPMPEYDDARQFILHLPEPKPLDWKQFAEQMLTLAVHTMLALAKLENYVTSRQGRRTLGRSRRSSTRKHSLKKYLTSN